MDKRVIRPLPVSRGGLSSRRFRAPSSKAHTLRALLLAALAKGESRIKYPLLGKDQNALIEALIALGSAFTAEGEELTVTGCGGRFVPLQSGIRLHLGESGVAMNFLAAAALCCDVPVILTGKEGLLRRPVAGIADGLIQLGGELEFLGENGFPPLLLKKRPGGGDAKISGATTSQYLSALTLSAPLFGAPVTLSIRDRLTERPYFDITVDMMSRFGVEVERRAETRYDKVAIRPGCYRAASVEIEGDYSSSAFYFLIAALTGLRISVTGLPRDSCQGDRAIVDIFCRMGCGVEREGDSVTVFRERGALVPLTIDMSDTPDLLPPVAVAAAYADGASRFDGVGQLRYKESDRLAAISSQLAKMGARCSVEADSLTVFGSGENGPKGAVIDPHNDHRIAMSFAVAGLVSSGQVIENPACVAKSFPDFWERMEQLHE